MKSILVFIFSCCLGSVYAQERTSNFDLRTQKTIFQIKKIEGKNSEQINLKSSISGQYSVDHKLNTQSQMAKKIDIVTAQKLDDEFVDKFINFKYLSKERTGKEKCIEIYFLDLRGETLKICSDEKAKVNELDKMIVKIKEEFLK